MTDEELLAQAAALVPVYVDGFGAFRKTNGVFRTVGWVADTGAVLNLIVMLEGAQSANFEAHRVLADQKKAVPGFEICNGTRMAH